MRGFTLFAAYFALFAAVFAALAGVVIMAAWAQSGSVVDLLHALMMFAFAGLDYSLYRLNKSQLD